MKLLQHISMSNETVCLEVCSRLKGYCKGVLQKIFNHFADI